MWTSLLLSAAALPCVADHAHYQLRSDPSVTAQFHPVARSQDWRSGLALEVRIGSSGRSYWFLPWQGGTNGKSNLAWVREAGAPVEGQPLREDVELFSTDAEYRFNNEIPRAGQDAPDRLFIPDLAILLFKKTPHNRRDSLDAKSFFDLVGCTDPAPGAPPNIEFPPVP
jgi:hypothetical protein